MNALLRQVVGTKEETVYGGENENLLLAKYVDRYSPMG